MRSLSLIAKAIARRVMEMAPRSISYTNETAGHWFSTVDTEAALEMRRLVAGDSVLSSVVKKVFEESELPKGIAGDVPYPALIVDAVEGSFNATRGLSCGLRRFGHPPIQAGTGLMLLEGEQLNSIAATAFYDWHSNLLFASCRGEMGSFFPLVDDQMIWDEDVASTRNDQHLCAIVPDYSNSSVRERIELEEKLQANGIQTQGGTQSSAQDLIKVLSGQADAYVDLRNAYPRQVDVNRDEVLRAWDVGPVLPLLDRFGFCMTAPGRDKHWQGCRFSDNLSLVVARDTEVWNRIQEVIERLTFVRRGEDAEDDSASVPMVSTRQVAE